MQDTTRTKSPYRKLARWLVTLAVVAIVAVFAGRSLVDGWQKLAATDFTIQPGWLVLAGLVYLVGLLPMAWFWRRVLLAFDHPSGAWPVLRAYYLGHLGKYVPGKAMVIALRTAAVDSQGGCRRAVVVSVFLETLTFMATGALLAGIAAPLAGEATWQIQALSVALALVAGLPCLPPVARVLAKRVAPKEQDGSLPPTWPMAITWKLAGSGIAAATFSWVMLSIGLWLAALSIGCEVGFLQNIPLWIAATTLPMVAGFLSLLPGGFGVRDGVLLGLLSAPLGPGFALATTTLWRVLTILAEAAVCGIMYASRLSPPSPPSGHST